MAERKDLIQDIQAVKASDLLASVADIKSAGYRLGQACATKTEGGIDVLYSFEKDEILKNLKVRIEDRDPELQSISGIYWAAFIYENEMHDLLGIAFKNLALDYGGHFFKIASETPWNPMDKRSAAPESDAADAAEVVAGDVKAAEKETKDAAENVKAAEKETKDAAEDVKVAEKETKDATEEVKVAEEVTKEAEDVNTAEEETKEAAKEVKAAEKPGKKPKKKAAKSNKKDEKGGEA
jgi:ech hydrogenase subunit D